MVGAKGAFRKPSTKKSVVLSYRGAHPHKICVGGGGGGELDCGTDFPNSDIQI